MAVGDRIRYFLFFLLALALALALPLCIVRRLPISPDRVLLQCSCGFSRGELPTPSFLFFFFFFFSSFLLLFFLIFSYYLFFPFLFILLNWDGYYSPYIISQDWMTVWLLFYKCCSPVGAAATGLGQSQFSR